MQIKPTNIRGVALLTMLIGSLLVLPQCVQAQDDEDYFEDILTEVVENENPVYKPVISLGSGIMSFWGDIQNTGNNMLNGNFGYKLNLSTLLGKKRYFKGNLFVIYGNLSGHSFNVTWNMQQQPLPIDDNSLPIFPNSAFSTDIWQFGLSVEYGFGHLLGPAKRFKPFLSIGVATILFTPKGNLTRNGQYYYAWSDGTLRNFRESGPNAFRARIVNLDDSYETDLASTDLYGTGSYSQNTFTIPVDFGFDFYLSERVNLRTGISINYTFTDQLDNYDNKLATSWNYPKINSYNDIFTFTYISMNLDLFSDPKTILVEKVIAEYEGNFDYDIFFADQDEDRVFDRVDLCPDTPVGVEVDSVGCPFDSDNDGIYDYMDKEDDTPQGAIVDENGVQLTVDALAEMFNKIEGATSRSNIKVIPLAHVWTRNRSFTKGKIPEKFINIDTNRDGYISFDELLKAINDYFDEKNNFTPDDINELNDYFFSQ